MAAEQPESPTPLLPATLQHVRVEIKDTPPDSRPRWSSGQSRHSSRRSSRPISELPPIHTRDPEKDAGTPAPQQCDSPVDDTCSYDATAEDTIAKDHALQILVYLSGPVFFVSLANFFIALVIVFITPLLLLVSLTRKERHFRTLLINLLAPPLRWQLMWIYASVPSATALPHSSRNSPSIYTNRNNHISPSSNHDTGVMSDRFSLPLLITIHLLSLLVSIGAVISSWISAFFWFYTGIIGDPEGTEAESRRTRKYYFYGEKTETNDGRASVLAVRAWWKGWLTRAVES